MQPEVLGTIHTSGIHKGMMMRGEVRLTMLVVVERDDTRSKVKELLLL
jgi:hypothetical protein